jgi:hypothetical protein
VAKSIPPTPPAIIDGQGSVGLSKKRNGTTTMSDPTIIQTTAINTSLELGFDSPFNGSKNEFSTGITTNFDKIHLE